jgi:4a-hydroxytetrahydrobiopterin dehydratase
VTDLLSRRCRPQPKGSPALGTAEAQAYLQELGPDWELGAEAISRQFHFANHYETMAFVNAVAWISHREDHHPLLEVGYNRCKVVYSTHSVRGLSENDFICAAKVDAL